MRYALAHVRAEFLPVEFGTFILDNTVQIPKGSRNVSEVVFMLAIEEAAFCRAVLATSTTEHPITRHSLFLACLLFAANHVPLSKLTQPSPPRSAANEQTSGTEIAAQAPTTAASTQSEEPLSARSAAEAPPCEAEHSGGSTARVQTWPMLAVLFVIVGLFLGYFGNHAATPSTSLPSQTDYFSPVYLTAIADLETKKTENTELRKLNSALQKENMSLGAKLNEPNEKIRMVTEYLVALPDEQLAALPGIVRVLKKEKGAQGAP